MSEDHLKEVDFHFWCSRCVRGDQPDDAICDECLENISNSESTRPIRFQPNAPNSDGVRLLKEYREYVDGGREEH